MESEFFGYSVEQLKTLVETILICASAVAGAGGILWRWVWVPSSKLITKINSIHDSVEQHFPTLKKIAEEFKPNGGNSLRDVLNRVENGQATSQEMYKLIIQDMKMASFQVDKTGQYTWVSSEWEDLTGIDIEEALGNGWINSVHPWDAKRVTEEWNEAIRQSRIFKSTYYANPNDPVKVKAYAAPVRDPRKNIIGWAGMISLVEKEKQDSKTQV